MGRSLDSLSSASYSPGPDSPGGGGKSPLASAYSPGLIGTSALPVFGSPVGGRVDSPRGGIGGSLYSPASDLSSSGGGGGLFSPGPLAETASSHFGGLFGGPWGSAASGLSGHSELVTPFSERPFAADVSAAATYAAALSGLMSRDVPGGAELSGSQFPGLAGTLADPLSAASQQYLWSMYLDKPKSAL